MGSKKLKRREFNKLSMAALGGALSGTFLGGCESTGGGRGGADPSPMVQEPQSNTSQGEGAGEDSPEMFIPSRDREGYYPPPESKGGWRLIKDTDQTPLRSLHRDAVEAFIRRRADNPRLEDWQVGQCVEAIRLLLKDLAGAPISADIDWDYWRGARHRLEENHATLARDEALEKSSIVPQAERD